MSELKLRPPREEPSPRASLTRKGHRQECLCYEWLTKGNRRTGEGGTRSQGGARQQQGIL